MNELEFKIVLNEKICDLAEAILHYYNPCELGKDSCLLSRKMGSNTVTCCYETLFDKHGDAERRCQFLKEEGGCGFRNVFCKIWLCATAIQNSPQCVEDLKDLENLAKRYDLTRRPFLGQRYVGMTKELEK